MCIEGGERNPAAPSGECLQLMIAWKAMLGEVLLCFYVCEMVGGEGGVFGCEWSGAICMGLM